jgi:hypothetical protein
MSQMEICSVLAKPVASSYRIASSLRGIMLTLSSSTTSVRSPSSDADEEEGE